MIAHNRCNIKRNLKFFRDKGQVLLQIDRTLCKWRIVTVDYCPCGVIQLEPHDPDIVEAEVCVGGCTVGKCKVYSRCEAARHRRTVAAVSEIFVCNRYDTCVVVDCGGCTVGIDRNRLESICVLCSEFTSGEVLEGEGFGADREGIGRVRFYILSFIYAGNAYLSTSYSLVVYESIGIEAAVIVHFLIAVPYLCSSVQRITCCITET